MSFPFPQHASGTSGIAIPVNTVAPTVSGGNFVHATLTTTNGTWDNNPTSYTYQWKDDGVDIGGATSQTFDVTSTQIGGAITCVVTASNAGGAGDPEASSNSITILAAGTNLLTKTQIFGNAAWTKENCTINTDHAVAPDGTTTADKLEETSAVTTAHRVYQSKTVTNGIDYTWSVFIKPVERTIGLLDFANPGANRTWFDLTGNGSVLTTAAGVTASIYPCAEGYYRLIVTKTTSNTSLFCACGPSTGDNIAAYTGVTGSGVELWGAMLESGSTANSYAAVA